MLARITLCLFAAGILSSASLAEEMVESMAYTMWAKYKPGTAVTYKTMSKFGDYASEGTMEMKLVEVTPEKVVIEMTTSMMTGGQEMKMPPQKVEYPKMVKKAEGNDMNPAEKDGKVGEGEEEVTVAGKTVKAKWYAYEIKQESGKTISRVWTSEDVPGMTVKNITKIEGRMSGESTMELVKIVIGQ